MLNLPFDNLTSDVEQDDSHPRTWWKSAQPTNYFELPLVAEKVTPPIYHFNKSALTNLSLADQILFQQFGQGALVAPAHTRLHHGFEAHAATNPHLLAAQHLTESITYGELDRQANRLASVLAQHGVQTGDHVALFLQRSIPMLVGIMATLKAGAAYIPQHIGVAKDGHLHHVLAVSNTKVILTIASLQHLVPVPEGCICIAIDELMQQPFTNEDAYRDRFLPAQTISSDNTCFVIFTSGTTGTPNGVQVTHRNVCNILLTEPGNLGMRPGVKVAQLLSIAFDMAAWETLGCLANGATLIIRNKNMLQAAQQADIIIATPSILGSLDADQLHNIKVIAVAGEPCPRPLADQWAAFCTFYNSCGPTETTIVNTAQHYLPWSERLTIGKPTPNNTVYVLDENRQPCKIGEVGEMWAGGECVSAGYLGNADLTAARYVDDPFLGDGCKMFRTRDLGRWTEDGELEHFGRTDNQVKVRGFRVELDSVSSALESTPDCKQAATLKLDSNHLVAFVSPATVDIVAAKQAVTDELPYFYVPQFIIPLDQLPMTARGKLDKRLLLQLAIEHNTTPQPALNTGA